MTTAKLVTIMLVERRRVLDIAIGFGGDYIRKDPSFVKRIGLDRSFSGVVSAQERYGVTPVVADANFLPFSESAFDQIDIVLSDYLVQDLTSPQNVLWQEFARILRPDGIVRVLVDESQLWAHGVRTTESREGRHLPTNMVRQAQRANFDAKWRLLGKDEVSEFQTRAVRAIASAEKLTGGEILTYEVIAINRK